MKGDAKEPKGRSKIDDGHLAWVTAAAGATFYLRALYQRLGDPKQAARAEKAGKAVQEQLQRMVPDAIQRQGAIEQRLRDLESSEGDMAAERLAWREAIQGLLAITIWAGVADSLQERATPSSIAKKASNALQEALEGARAAFPDVERREIVEALTPVAVDESLRGLARLLDDQGSQGMVVLEGLEEQVRDSVRKYLAPWMD